MAPLPLPSPPYAWLRGCFPVLGSKAASLCLASTPILPRTPCLPASAVTRAPPFAPFALPAYISCLGCSAPRPVTFSVCNPQDCLRCLGPKGRHVSWPPISTLTYPHSRTLPLSHPALPNPFTSHFLTHPPTHLPPAGTERRPWGRQRTTFRPGQLVAEEGQSGIKAAGDLHPKCDHHVRQAVEPAGGYEPGGAPERFTSRIRSHG
jgi:hypothetical protein